MKVQVGGGFVAVAPAITADGEALRRRATLRPRARALVVLHECEDVGGRLVQSVWRLRPAPVIARAEAGEALPDPATFRLAVLVGSASFADAHASGQLASEVEWIRQADAAGTAVFGIGHGARALAYAFGGAVEPAPRPHRGWTLVETTVPHQIAAGPWLAWQRDVIALADGAELLAENRLGPQAFRIGRHVGVQFHPEATPNALRLARRSASGSASDSTAWPLIDVLKPDAGAAEVRSRRLIEGFAAAA
ncbi:MAG: type 1 glutamine amidotransferase [Solirubrobacteraceae bacterium]